MGAQPKAAEHGHQYIEKPRTELHVHGGLGLSAAVQFVMWYACAEVHCACGQQGMDYFSHPKLLSEGGVAL
eukprot:2152119-Pyramimonas_sp.AAC.1